MKNVLEDVPLTFMAAHFTNMGYNVVCAGGAARDTLHGVRPKDYDFVVMVGGEMAFEAGQESPYFVQAFVENYNDMPSSAISWVLKYDFDGLQVDLIKYIDPLTTPEEVVEHFDCTLNMVWFDSNGIVRQHARYPKFKDEPVYMLPLCDNVDARMAYLSQKYPQYTFKEAA